MRTFTTILTGFLATLAVECFTALVASVAMGRPSLPCAAYAIVNVAVLAGVVRLDSRGERRKA